MKREVNLCDSCIHLASVTGWSEGEMGPPPCHAYPAGIPVEIWYGGMDHREPIAGDRGVQYQASPDGGDTLDEWIYRRDREDVSG